MHKSSRVQTGVALWGILAGIATFTTIGLFMARAVSEFNVAAFDEQSAKALASAVVADAAVIVGQIKALQAQEPKSGQPDLTTHPRTGVFAPGRLSLEQKQPPYRTMLLTEQGLSASSSDYQFGEISLQGISTARTHIPAIYHLRIRHDVCLAINIKVNGVNGVPRESQITAEQLFNGQETALEPDFASGTFGWTAGCVQGNDQTGTAAFFAIVSTL